MGLANHVALCAEATRDDHPAVLRERFTYRAERLPHCRLDEPAGVDDDEIGPGVRRRNRVALRAQSREDAFGIDQSFGTAERDEADLWRRFQVFFSSPGAFFSLGGCAL